MIKNPENEGNNSLEIAKRLFHCALLVAPICHFPICFFNLKWMTLCVKDIQLFGNLLHFSTILLPIFLLFGNFHLLTFPIKFI